MIQLSSDRFYSVELFSLVLQLPIRGLAPARTDKRTSSFPSRACAGPLGTRSRRQRGVQAPPACHPAPPPPPQAHEEVLRLLLAVAPRLDAMQLSNYLTRTLNNSKWVLLLW